MTNELSSPFKLPNFHLPAWFTAWYMGRIAGRYCPCEWPIKSKRLIRLCGWIDDEEARHDFIRYAGWVTSLSSTVTTTSNAHNVTVTYANPVRKGHGGNQ